jgi:hypothetical protein
MSSFARLAYDRPSVDGARTTPSIAVTHTIAATIFAYYPALTPLQGERPMLGRKWLRVTISLGILAFASPALAAKIECNEETMTKMNSEISSMAESEAKTNAMKQMDAAKGSMTSKNMDACTEHMKAANHFMGKK